VHTCEEYPTFGGFSASCIGKMAPFQAWIKEPIKVGVALVGLLSYQFQWM
jgi:hypothetical protein